MQGLINGCFNNGPATMGMKLAPNERLVAALVTKETKEILKAMADREGISMSQLLREMIDHCLKEILDNDNGKTWAINTLQECIATHPNDRTREQADKALAYLQN